MPNFLVYKLYPPSFIKKKYKVSGSTTGQFSNCLKSAAYLFEASEGN